MVANPRARKAAAKRPATRTATPVVEEPAKGISRDPSADAMAATYEQENAVTVEFVTEVPARKGGGGGRKPDFLKSGIAEQLVANPGAWARIAVRSKMGTAAGYSGRIRKTAWEGGRFESTVRQTGDEEFSVYARFDSDQASE